MSMNFLLGVPGKLKTLLDRWTQQKADYINTSISSRASATQAEDIKGSGFASGTDSLKVLSDNIDLIKGTSFASGTDSLKILSDKIDIIDSNVDSINSYADATISSRATASALSTVDNNVDTILSRVTASVATASALATVDANVDKLVKAQDLFEIQGFVQDTDSKTTVINVSNSSGDLLFMAVGANYSYKLENADIYVTTDGGTERLIDLDERAASTMYDTDTSTVRLPVTVHYNSSLLVAIDPPSSGSLSYYFLWTVDK